MNITPIYASLLALLLIWLSARVIGMRRAKQISIGNDGDVAFQRAIRAQANFAEYTPMALLLIAMAEFQAAPFAVVPSLAIHLLGGMLLAGRLAHGLAFSSARARMKLRVGGMMLTFASLGLAALLNLALAFAHMG